MLSLEEAKSSIKYYRMAHPNHYKEMGGDKITDKKIVEALEIVDAIAGGLNISEDELFRKELTRLCNESN